MGEKPMFYYLVVFPPLFFVTFCLIQPLPTSLMLQLVVGGVIAEVVVVVAGCQPYPRLPILLPHALFPGQFTLPRFWSVGSSRTGFGGVFGLTQVFFLSPTSC